MSGANSTDNFTTVDVAGHAHRLAHHPAHIEPKPRGIAAKKRELKLCLRAEEKPERRPQIRRIN